MLRIIKRTPQCWQKQGRTATERSTYIKNDVAIRYEPHCVDKFNFIVSYMKFENSVNYRFNSVLGSATEFRKHHAFHFIYFF